MLFVLLEICRALCDLISPRFRVLLLAVSAGRSFCLTQTNHRIIKICKVTRDETEERGQRWERRNNIVKIFCLKI